MGGVVVVDGEPKSSTRGAPIITVNKRETQAILSGDDDSLDDSLSGSRSSIESDQCNRKKSDPIPIPRGKYPWY